MSDYLKKLRHVPNNASKDNVLAFIKENVNPGEFEIAINTSPLLKRAKLRDNKFEKIESIVQRDPYTFTEDFRRELYWLMYNFNNQSYEITRFLIAKKEFEKEFLFSNYEIAENLLNNIILEFGENLWTIESSILIKEYKCGTKENWAELSNSLKKLKSPFYKFVSNFYSKRIEKNMSFENCVAQFQNDFQGVISDSMVRDFLVFKSLYVANYAYHHENLEGVLFIANVFSTIDQYLITVEILMKLVSDNTKNDRVILQFVKKISSKIDCDDRLKNIINILEETSEIIVLKTTEILLPIIDSYTLGDFDYCLSKCDEYLRTYPTSFELYELYCKSLINLNKDFLKTNISVDIDNILYLTYDTLLFKKDSEKSRTKLLKLSLTYQSFNFGKQIWAFAISLVLDPKSNNFQLINCICSSINNPKLMALDLDLKESRLNSKHKVFKNSPALNINLFISGKIKTIDFLSNSEVQAEVYLARNLFSQSKFEDVIKILKKYINVDIPRFYYDNVLYLLFQSYLNINDLEKALKMSATIMINDEIYTTKFNIFELVGKIKRSGIEKYSNRIELPIIFSNVLNDYDLYEAYIEFMLFHDDEYPSKLNVKNLINEFGREKVIYFLNKVCTIRTMQYSLEFSSIDKAEQERLEICNILKVLDIQNKNLYDQEISDILRASAVRKAIKEVNEGRLYVNVENLKNHQLNNLNESFNRYKEIELTTKDKSLIGFNSSKSNWEIVDFTPNEIHAQYSNPTFLAFRSIYLETREKFLYSKEYGLDSCLSTNFRHGAVKNHIRSVFEKLNLITSKLGEKYIENKHWTDQLSANQELNHSVQSRLREFSREIDNYTVHIIDNLIQIKTERNREKKEGLFDFSTDEKTLYRFFEENKSRFSSVDDIVDIIYTSLTNFTQYQICLHIEDTFTKSINSYYQNLIENLQFDLRQFNLGNECELLPNIIKSTTKIQSELEVIAKWFTLNTTSSSSILDIETVITASKEYINRINPNTCIVPQVNIQYPFHVYSNLIFVFNILFNNILEHSKTGKKMLNVTIDVYNPKDAYIEVKITNPISSKINIENIETKLSLIKSDWNNHENIARSNIEGGSGFDKIKKLLLYEAMAKTDKFDYEVTRHNVSISLFLPFKSATVTVENVIKGTFYNFKSEKFKIVIGDGCDNCLISSKFVFIFMPTISKLISFSNLSHEDLDLTIKVFKVDKRFFEVKFITNLHKTLDTQNIKNLLFDIKENWENLDNLSNEKAEDFKEIKFLIDKEVIPSESGFDFEINSQNLAISLFFPFIQQNDEENSNN